MKNAISTTVILKALDLELKAMLQQDLNQFKAAKQNANHQSAAKKQAA